MVDLALFCVTTDLEPQAGGRGQTVPNQSKSRMTDRETERQRERERGRTKKTNKTSRNRNLPLLCELQVFALFANPTFLTSQTKGFGHVCTDFQRQSS